MSLLDAVLAAATLLSFAIAVWSMVNSAIKKSREEANIAIMKERLSSVYDGLYAVFHGVDAIVQIPKARPDTAVEELQNIARILRAQIHSQAQRIKKSQVMLKRWRYGQVVTSEQEQEEESSAESAADSAGLVGEGSGVGSQH